MGRRWRPLFGLLLGLVAVDVAVRLNRPTWERYSPDDYAERLSGAARSPRDLLFIGGSPVSEGFDPELFVGLNWRGHTLENPYSLGLPGGTLTDDAFALRGALARQSAPPRLVVYGITATDVNDARNEPHGPYSVWTWGDYRDCWASRPEARSWATRRFLEGQAREGWALFVHRHGVRMAAAAALDGLAPGSVPKLADEARRGEAYWQALRAGRGYAPADFFAEVRYDEAKASGKPAAPFGFLDKYHTGSHWGYLARVVLACRDCEADLVLIDMPVTADLEARYPGPLAEYRGRLAGFERDNLGVRVLRADAKALGLTDADFGDIIHLNRVGAAKLSRWARAALAEAGAAR